MIVGFADPFSEELLYSSFARSAERLPYDNTSQIAQTLLGDKNAVAIHDLPNRLQYLLDNLPPGHKYTLDRLINYHTLFPYYTPFQPPDTVQEIRDHMALTDTRRINSLLGKSSTTIRFPDYLRYCVACYEEASIPFWHRLPQVPGVYVCPEHGVLLSSSVVGLREREDPRRYELITDARADIGKWYITPDDAKHVSLLNIAEDSLWLLQNHNIIVDMEKLREKYRRVATDRRFFKGKRLKRHELVDAFEQRFSKSFLAFLGCQVDKKGSWVIRLLQGKSAPKLPLYHILMAHFFDAYIGDFISDCLIEDQ